MCSAICQASVVLNLHLSQAKLNNRHDKNDDAPKIQPMNKLGDLVVVDENALTFHKRSSSFCESLTSGCRIHRTLES
jgi:hypothetical protein